MIVSTALFCLAANVFFEARSETIPGQYAVALVTVNRAELKPAKVCDEVFKPKQFSWANDRSKVRKVKGGWEIPLEINEKNWQAWTLAMRVAEVTLSGKMPDFTRGATFYHTHQVKPIWRHQLVSVHSIGNHRFYRLPA